MPQSLLNTLGTGLDLLLVVVGFGLIIFIHELGHFLAARWAGIRVLAFAVGFGPALFSYRRGLGFRRGSSVAEVQKLAESRGLARPGRPPVIPGISPTEYRLNVLPFGGYVKMLGQEDADPSARSDEPDGYQSTPPWKRMIVISAGVVANFILAACLFVAVFMLGLTTEPATVGAVEPASPAATAVAINAKKLNITEPGLQPGDKIRRINDERPDDFSEVVVATAMSRQGSSLRFEVERDGYDERILFDVLPKVEPTTKLLQIGVAPAVSAEVIKARTPDEQQQLEKLLAANHLTGVKGGMRLVRVGDDTKVDSVYDIETAARRSNGTPFDIAFRDPAGGPEAVIQITPERQLARQLFWPSPDRVTPSPHILGFVPVMSVDDVIDKGAAKAAGMQKGDIFVQVGSVEWPSTPEGMAEIRAAARGSVRVVVLRDVNSETKEVDLGEIPVTRAGTIGFYAGNTASTSTRITAWPRELLGEADAGLRATPPPAVALALMRGSRILRVNDTPVSSFAQLADQLIAATAVDTAATVRLAIELPVKENGVAATDTVEWIIPREAATALHDLTWASPIRTDLFEREEITLQAADPIDAIGMGLSRTHRVMMQTYLTFSRLFQGSVKVEHLKGPVGIAHIGTMVASRGYVHLLFFLALISVNLGVVNFLPIPIADGGQFLFLVYEQITGKPVSVAFQNMAALAGLILIAGMFLLVTYNDIANLFG